MTQHNDGKHVISVVLVKSQQDILLILLYTTLFGE